MSRKAPDTSAIPLCARHHLWEHPWSYHRLGRGVFEVLYGIRIDAVVAHLHTLYVIEAGLAPLAGMPEASRCA